MSSRATEAISVILGAILGSVGFGGSGIVLDSTNIPAAKTNMISNTDATDIERLGMKI